MPHAVTLRRKQGRITRALPATGRATPTLSPPPAPTAPSPAPVLETREQRVRAIWRNAAAWTFQGWLAMFFCGAAYAKLTAPFDHIVLLLGWPALVAPAAVKAIGAVELLLALSMLAPLVLGMVKGRRIVIAGAVILLGLEGAALLVHAARLDIGLAFVNFLLLGLTTSVLALRRDHA